MSSFRCIYCEVDIIDTPKGYVTGCQHYPLETKNDAPAGKADPSEDFMSYFFDTINSPRENKP